MADDSVPSGTFTHGTVTNNDATSYGGRNSICQRSGFKAKPEQLVKDWTGLWVLPQFKDTRNPQDLQHSRPREDRGISDSVGSDDNPFISGTAVFILTENEEFLVQEARGRFITEDFSPISVSSL